MFARRMHMRSSVPSALNPFLSAYCLVVAHSERYFAEDYFVAVTTVVSGAAMKGSKAIVIKNSVAIISGPVEHRLKNIKKEREKNSFAFYC